MYACTVLCAHETKLKVLPMNFLYGQNMTTQEEDKKSAVCKFSIFPLQNCDHFWCGIVVLGQIPTGFKAVLVHGACNYPQELFKIASVEATIGDQKWRQFYQNQEKNPPNAKNPFAWIWETLNLKLDSFAIVDKLLLINQIN